jgi:hypothetical protein
MLYFGSASAFGVQLQLSDRHILARDSGRTLVSIYSSNPSQAKGSLPRKTRVLRKLIPGKMKPETTTRAANLGVVALFISEEKR